ncbi:MAG: acyltransferase domain-containing protein, partial [Desulfobacteraceae bacterium]|nr:acyltransferase domain-containing protein [Desulfobacteraceae bacterium]
MRKSVLLYERTLEELIRKCRCLLVSLRSSDGDAVYAGLVAWEIPPRRFYPRAGFVWDSRARAIESLDNMLTVLSAANPPEAWEDNSGGVYRFHGVNPKRQKLVAVFSGQGTLYANMGKRLLASFPILEQGFSHMDEIMAQSGLMPISDLLFPAKDLPAKKKRRFAKYLYQTQYTQPAIGVFAAGLYRIMEILGFKPGYVGGFSFGEVLALWAGRVFSDKTFFKVVNVRGTAMALPPAGNCGEGGMMAVTGPRVECIIPWIDPVPDVVVEAWNSHNQLVLSGLRSRLEDIQFTLQEKGFDAFILPVSGAFHSPFMKTARQAFSAALES